MIESEGENADLSLGFFLLLHFLLLSLDQGDLLVARRTFLVRCQAGSRAERLLVVVLRKLLAWRGKSAIA